MEISDNILSIISKSPETIIKGIAERVKERRLECALTQRELAGRAGIPLPTYRRFERTGEMSVRSLIMLGITLGRTQELSELFSTKEYGSMDDLLKAKKNKKRQRGKRNG